MKRALLCLLVVVSGCASALPIRGQSVDGIETFSGSSVGTIEGGGTLTITSNLGRVCRGQFFYVGTQQGAGTVNCNDGSSGSFQFVGAGSRGTGTGVIGGRQVTFTFG